MLVVISVVMLVILGQNIGPKGLGEDTGGNVGGNIVGYVGNIGNVSSTIGSNIGW